MSHPKNNAAAHTRRKDGNKGKDVKILPLGTNFYVEATARKNFNVVSIELL
jgi:hypothetical protein